jgi:hypothetical protein
MLLPRAIFSAYRRAFFSRIVFDILFTSAGSCGVLRKPDGTAGITLEERRVSLGFGVWFKADI